MACLRAGPVLILLTCLVTKKKANDQNGSPDYYLSDIENFNRRIFDLRNATIRATAPEGNLTQGEVVFHTVAGKLQYHSGFGVDVLHSLQIALGFKIEAIPAKSWATQFPNGSWFGMAQKVIENEADFSVAKTSVLPNRAKELGYLVPIHGLGLYAFFIQPSSNADQNIFFDPFTPILWMSILWIYILLIASIKLIAFIAENNTLDLTSDDTRFADETTMWSIYAISQQGFYISPSMPSLRIVLLAGVALSLVIYVSYAAHLVSMFSLESVPIKSILDLLRSNIHLTVDMNNKAARTLTESNSTDSADLVSTLLKKRHKLPPIQFLSAVEGGSRVLNARAAFLTFKDTFYTTVKNTFGTNDFEFCRKVSALPVTDVKFRSGLFVAKRSWLKEPFNIKIIAMYTSGLLTRFVRGYEDQYEPTCDHFEQVHLKSSPGILFSDVIFAFYCILFGFCSSLFICLLEIFYKNRKTLSNCFKATLALLLHRLLQSLRNY